VLDPSAIHIASGDPRTNTELLCYDVAGNASGFLVTYQLYYQAYVAFRGELHATRVGPSGDVQQPAGLPVAASPSDQESCSVASDGDGYLVAWHEDLYPGVGDTVVGRVRAATFYQAGVPGIARPVRTAVEHSVSPSPEVSSGPGISSSGASSASTARSSTTSRSERPSGDVGKRFSMTERRRDDEDDDRYECSRCEAVFDTNAELQAHRATAHGEAIDEAVKKAEPEVRRIGRL
jgi:hypothetical protein